MNIGLPGAGVGGLYYLACTSFMPIKEIYLCLTKSEHKFRYRLVITQLGIACGIVLGLIAMYLLVSNVFGLNLSLADNSGGEQLWFYSLLPVLISLGLLLVLLGLIEVAAYLAKKNEALDDVCRGGD